MSVPALNALSARSVESAAERSARVGALNLAKNGQLGSLSALPEAQQVKAVAGQFESILLRQFLQFGIHVVMGDQHRALSREQFSYAGHASDAVGGRQSFGHAGPGLADGACAAWRGRQIEFDVAAVAGVHGRGSWLQFMLILSI